MQYHFFLAFGSDTSLFYPTYDSRAGILVGSATFPCTILPAGGHSTSCCLSVNTLKSIQSTKAVQKQGYITNSAFSRQLVRRLRFFWLNLTQKLSGQRLAAFVSLEWRLSLDCSLLIFPLKESTKCLTQIFIVITFCSIGNPCSVMNRYSSVAKWLSNSHCLVCNPFLGQSSSFLIASVPFESTVFSRQSLVNSNISCIIHSPAPHSNLV